VYALVVGRLIGILRERRGWTQAELASRVGVTQPTLSRIERGQAVPELYDARRFAQAFGMRPEAFSKLVEDAFSRTQAVTSQVQQRNDQDPWEAVLKVVGIMGLVGVVALAVAALLDE
jgi:transcriptional regulator with XRE-family HTH domain